MSNQNEIIAKLFGAIEKTDASLNRLKNDATKIEQKYDPVDEAKRLFNNWRDSNDGQVTKQKLYETQQRWCANPQCKLKKQTFPIEYFEIDHKLPVTKYPHLAIEKHNMQLLCTPCNRKKSSKT